MTRQQRSRILRGLRLLVLEWDATTSAVAAIAFWWLTGLSDRPLDVPGPPIYAAVTIGATLGAAAFVTGRWISDRLAKDEYGTVIVAFDPDESMTQRPYFLVTIAGFSTALYGIFLATTLGEFSRSIGVILYGLLVGLCCYCLLGSISLAILTRRHQRRASVIRSLKEADARRRRLADRERKDRESDGKSTDG
jgi:hypothetical protein